MFWFVCQRGATTCVLSSDSEKVSPSKRSKKGAAANVKKDPVSPKSRKSESTHSKYSRPVKDSHSDSSKSKSKETAKELTAAKVIKAIADSAPVAHWKEDSSDKSSKSKYRTSPDGKRNSLGDKYASEGSKQIKQGNIFDNANSLSKESYKERDRIKEYAKKEDVISKKKQDLKLEDQNRKRKNRSRSLSMSSISSASSNEDSKKNKSSKKR